MILKALGVASISVGLIGPWGAGLDAQTAGPIVREGRYWVQLTTGTVPAGARLRVSAAGSISVRGERVGEVRYQSVVRVRARTEAEARLLLEQAPLAAAKRGPTVTIAIDEPQCGRCGFRADVEIVAPSGTAETILATQGGALSVEGMSGRVNADSAGGSISFDEIGGDVRATTAGGAISLGSIGGSVRCETAGGSISVESARGDAVLNTSGGSITVGSVGRSFRAESAGGGIQVSRVDGPIIAGTSGGSIEIGQAAGQVRAETAGGSIRVAAAPQGVRAETAGGDIRLLDVAGQVFAASAAGDIQAYFLAGQPLRDSLLETNVGSIVVWIPADLKVTIEALVEFSKSLNRIESEFGDVVVRRVGADGFGGVQAVGALNGGGPVLRVRNTNGRILIRKRD